MAGEATERWKRRNSCVILTKVRIHWRNVYTIVVEGAPLDPDFHRDDGK
jgi:hypothetical protein